MELQEVDIFIDQDGQVRVEVRGVKGSHCLTLTKDLERALGEKIAQREMTPEANESSDEKLPNQQLEGEG